MTFRISRIWDERFSTYRFEITDDKGLLLLTASNTPSDVVLLWENMAQIAGQLSDQS